MMNDMRAPRLDLQLWLDDALRVVALRLQHEVALTRTLRGDGRQEKFLGLFVDDDEAEAILAELSGRVRVAGAAQSAQQIDALFSDLSAARIADSACIWARYANTLALSEVELDLLLFASAPALDPRIGRVYGYLNDDLARRYLTPWLARLLLDRHSLSMLDLRNMLGPDGPLRLFGLLECTETRPWIDTPVRINEGVLDQLLGAPIIANPVCVIVPPANPATTPQQVTHTVIVLGGPDHDPGYSAAVLAARAAQPLAILPAAHLAGLSETDSATRLKSILRDLALLGTLPYLDGFQSAPAALRREIARIGAALPCCVAADAPHQWQDSGLNGVVFDTPLAPIATRLAALDALTANHPLDLGPAIARLSQSGKAPFAPVASILSRHHDIDQINGEISRLLTNGLNGLAQRVTSAHTLDDLVINRPTRQVLDSIISWRHHAGTILDDWQLGQVFRKRRACTALFKGPSGTGKTMAASVISNVLDLPLYRVDLAGMISKYIGETERNLDRLFTAAEASDVVLFFDECDAIFGKRSEVNDAHDRYANIETSFLLQRLEQFDGIAILATNMPKNMDEAFLRRIDLVADFPAPGARQRLQLWQRLALGRAPLADDIDYSFLADQFDLTGGEIRNCCLDAAHRAAASDAPISMPILVLCVARELQKQGKPLHNALFGRYNDYVKAGLAK